MHKLRRDRYYGKRPLGQLQALLSCGAMLAALACLLWPIMPATGSRLLNEAQQSLQSVQRGSGRWEV